MFAAAGPGFPGGPAGPAGPTFASEPAAPGGLADQEGTAHKSRRAQAKPLPAKASGNSPPQIRDIVPPGSSGGNSMALFRDSRAYHLRQSWLLVIARVWSTPRVVRSALIAQVLPDNRASL